MVGIPAWCPNCQKIVGGAGGVPAVTITDATNITLRGVTTRCPKCRQLGARVLEGTFNARTGDLGEEVLEIVSAPAWTRHHLAKYRDALDFAVENYRDRPIDALREIGRASPEAEQLLRSRRERLSTDQMVNLITLIAALVGLMLQGVDTALDVLEHLRPEPVPIQQIFQTIENDPRLQQQLDELQEQLNRLDEEQRPGARLEPEQSPKSPPHMPTGTEEDPGPPATESPG